MPLTRPHARSTHAPQLGRRLALGVALGCVPVLALGCSTTALPGPASSATPAPGGGSSAQPGSATPAPSAGSATPSASTGTGGCAGLAARLSLREQVGQLLMVAVTSTGATAAERSVLADTDAGSALLLGNSTAGLDATQQVVADVRDAAVRPQRVGVLVAADQEGGRVQRLAGEGFTDVPSAVRQAQLSDAVLRESAASWAGQLSRAGVNANLAPVADVVPRDLQQVNEPIALLSRGYGSSPTVVAAKVGAFVQGMNETGMATAVKHFPGLGRVRGNTDTTAGVVDTATTRDDPALAGFETAVDDGVDMVMVSSATYSRIDGRRPAVFSPTVVGGMIRDDLGFDGVVISDDLSAVALQQVAAGQRMLRFLSAGGDLAIVADGDDARDMADALLEAAQDDPQVAARVAQSATRVLQLKDRRGLADC